MQIQHKYKSRTLRNRRNGIIAAVLGVTLIAGGATYFFITQSYKSLGFNTISRDKKGKIELRIQEGPRLENTNCPAEYTLPSLQFPDYPIHSRQP